MWRWARGLVVLGLLVVSTPQRGSSAPYVVPAAETRELPQRSANGRDYLLHVSFPLSYETAGPERRYPVVYVCDGYWDFPLVATMADFVRRDGHAPETIVVGIGYAGSAPDVGLLRQWDLTPGVDEEFDPEGETTGHADAFLDVLQQEIIPLVESTYRADPGHRVLLGSSFGGLFALYAALQRPSLFQGYVVSSPALYWRDEYILGLARSHAAARRPLNARMFISWGSGDTTKLLEPARRFAQEIAGLGIPGLRVAAREIEGAGHSGNKPESFTRGLRFVFAPQSWVAPAGPDPGYGALGRFVNLSTRGMVRPGEGVLIGGFVVEGILKKRMLVRAAGPALESLHVGGVLSDPRLRILDADGRAVADNDNWDGLAGSAAVAAGAEQVGAFPFLPGSRDAGLVVVLDPGRYTVVVDGVGGASGIALVEAYEVGP